MFLKKKVGTGQQKTGKLYNDKNHLEEHHTSSSMSGYKTKDHREVESLSSKTKSLHE